MATVSNDSSVFTFTPKTKAEIATAVAAGNLTDSNGDFNYTFKWSDGINFVSKEVTITYSPAPLTGFTRGLISGGTYGSGGYTNIEMFTLATGGSTTSFGNMSIGRGGHTSFGNASRSLFAGETGSSANSEVSSVEYVAPATTGNGASFGNMNGVRAWMGSVASLTRGVIGNGADYSPPVLEVVGLIIIDVIILLLTLLEILLTLVIWVVTREEQVVPLIVEITPMEYS